MITGSNGQKISANIRKQWNTTEVHGKQLNTEEIAGNDADKAVDAELLQLDAADSSRPLIPERIQRPELPPFQRMRPAVDRASITPPRPRPMAI
jgi:hypothetical protein